MPRKKASPAKQSAFQLNSGFHSINFKQRDFKFTVKQRQLLDSILSDDVQLDQHVVDRLRKFDREN